MTEAEIKAVLTVAQETLRSKSKLALFCVELSHELYDEWPNRVDQQLPRPDALQTEYELFWNTMRPFLQLQG